MRLKTIAIIAFALLIAGCAGHQTQEILCSVVVPTTATEIAGNHSIFIATTRKLQALGMLIAETRVTNAAAGERTAAIRAIVTQVITIAGTVLRAFYVLVLTSTL